MVSFCLFLPSGVLVKRGRKGLNTEDGGADGGADGCAIQRDLQDSYVLWAGLEDYMVSKMYQIDKVMSGSRYQRLQTKGVSNPPSVRLRNAMSSWTDLSQLCLHKTHSEFMNRQPYSVLVLSLHPVDALETPLVLPGCQSFQESSYFERSPQAQDQPIGEVLSAHDQDSGD